MPKGIPNKKTETTADVSITGVKAVRDYIKNLGPGDLIPPLLGAVGATLPTVKHDPYTASAKSIEITLQPLDGSARIRVLNTDRSMRSRTVDVAYPSGEADAGE